MISSVESDLILVGAISPDQKELFSVGTRDNVSVSVYRDRKSGVIYIPDYYCGDDQYTAGEYRNKPLLNIGKGFKKASCLSRYTTDLLQFYAGKDIVDFGCGSGEFLRAINQSTKSAIGVELQSYYLLDLIASGIN
jgi:hypothetical protein